MAALVRPAEGAGEGEGAAEVEEDLEGERVYREWSKGLYREGLQGRGSKERRSL